MLSRISIKNKKQCMLQGLQVQMYFWSNKMLGTQLIRKWDTILSKQTSTGHKEKTTLSSVIILTQKATGVEASN